MATAKKTTATPEKTPAASTRKPATKKPSSSATAAPQTRTDVNPAGSWPFPTGKRP